MLGHRRARNPIGNKTLQIAWINVGRGTASHIAALQIAYDKQYDILCIQEPATYVGTRTQTHPGFTLYPPIDSWGDSGLQEDLEEQRPRVLTYIQKGAGLRYEPRQSLHNRDLLWTDVNGIAILNVYRQPQMPSSLHYVTHLSPPARCVVGGDFNAKHSTFEPGVQTSQGGTELVEWAAMSGMDYIGQPGVATHQAGHVIDLSFSNIPFATTVVTEDAHCGSDHYTLLTTIPGRGTEPLEQYHFKVKDKNLHKFAGLVELGMHGIPDVTKATTEQEVLRCIQHIVDAWTNAQKEAGTPQRGSGHSAPWWTDECKSAYHLHLNSRRGHTDGRITDETRAFLATVRKAKKSYWQNRIDGAKDGKDLWSIIAWHKLEPTRQETPLEYNGSTLIDPKDKAEALREAILFRFSADDDLPMPPEPQNNPTLPWDTYLGMEETEQSAIGISSTSPGIDRFTVRLMKAAWPYIGSSVRDIYRKCLDLNYFPHCWRIAEVSMIPKVGKKDRSSVRSYRPIALLSAFGKGFERILARRMAWTALTHNILSPQHGGALPKRAATDLAASFTHDVQEVLWKRRCVTMVTMDVKGAFDAVLKNRLLHRMKDQGWPERALRMTDSFLSDRSVQVRLGRTVTDQQKVPCGTPQGSPWSPILYALYLAPLLNQDRKYRFGYADDILVYGTGSTLEESSADAAEKVRAVQQWGDENKVLFAPEKREAIHLTRQHHTDNPDIIVEDNDIVVPIQQDPSSDEQPALRWLGVWFDRKLSFRRHVAIRAAKAHVVAHHIRSLARTVHGPPAASLRRAVLTCVIPRLLYGTEAWYGGRFKNPPAQRAGCNSEVSTRLGWHIQLIHRTLTHAARGILPSYRTTPTATLFRDSGLPSGLAALEEAKARFAMRIHTVDNMHPLASRVAIPLRQRGIGAGLPQNARTTVQRLGLLLQPVLRPTLVPPHYSTGCRHDPTEGIRRKKAARAFKKWWAALPASAVTVFSDGSEQRLADRTRHVTYGYAIYKGGRQLATGRGSLHPRSHVFDAEAVGAWRGLKHTLDTYGHEASRVWMCIDSTSVIWCLRGNAAPSSHWAFVRCHQAMEVFNIGVKWSPGHSGIEGNEAADTLADQEAHNPTAPFGEAAEPTVSGLRSDMRTLCRVAEGRWWGTHSTKLSRWYKQWQLPYKPYKAPDQLDLDRPVLAKLLAIRTSHGDFAWYHTKFRHEDAELSCTCGKLKTPDHIVHCKLTRKRFRLWPERPLYPPSNAHEGIEYLRMLLDNPPLFASFLELAHTNSQI